MSTSKGRCIMQAAGLLTMAAAVSLGMGGCSGGCSRENGPDDSGAISPRNAKSFEDRMHDPEYLKALKGQEDEMRLLMKRMEEARAALAFAKESGAGDEEIRRLEGVMAKCVEEAEANRRASQKIVRDRLVQAKLEQEKFVEEQQRKGN